MAIYDLWLKPHKIDDDGWWYEEPKGITVVVHTDTQGAKQVFIPWRTIRAALRRLDK